MERLYIIGCLNKTVASLRLYAAITLIFHRLRVLRAYLAIPTRPVIRHETPHLVPMSWLCRNPEPDASDRALLKFSQGQSEAFSIRKDEEGCNTEVYIAGERYNQPLHLSSEHEWEQWLQQFGGESAGLPNEKGDRNGSVIRRKSRQLLVGKDSISIISVGSDTIQVESENDFTTAEDDESCAMLWIKISHLKNGLENWKTQLVKMLDHVQELEDTNFGVDYRNMTALRGRRDALVECGKRIRERLRDLIDEYDNFIRECDHIMAGMSLAMQLDLNNIGRKDARLNENISRSSLAVAETAQRDGSLMKSIAVLGMIYLPATFVCTFFSMGFFQWSGQSGNTRTVSPDVWIFALVAVAFTLLTIGVFVACTIGRSSRVKAKLHIV
ncbi:hypothetical protein MKX08_000943 [Trichoderma sp. CBMAI-0020]|nr:hypothetical protein MKX08_000943 [Trichoderma sp. CBMAI-0020]